MKLCVAASLLVALCVFSPAAAFADVAGAAPCVVEHVIPTGTVASCIILDREAIVIVGTNNDVECRSEPEGVIIIIVGDHNNVTCNTAALATPTP